MVRFLAICITLFSTLLYSLISYADVVQTEQAKVSLLIGEYSETGVVEAGLLYEIEDGWQIYWREPGDSGYPQNISWQASQNISDFHLYWPLPKR